MYVEIESIWVEKNEQYSLQLKKKGKKIDYVLFLLKMIMIGK